MNKKLLVLALIIAIPAMAFADFQLGVTSMYGNPIGYLTSGYDSLTMDDLLWGAEARVKLSIFQGDVSAYYMPASFNNYSSYETDALLIMTDVGLSLDIFFLRIGAGIGPMWVMPMAGSPGGTAWNMKLKADVNLGSIALGLSAYYEAAQFGDLWTSATYESGPYVSANLLIKLF